MYSLEIAYLLARGSFNWLFTVDDLIMVVPYFWAFMLAQDNDVRESDHVKRTMNNESK